MKKYLTILICMFTFIYGLSLKLNVLHYKLFFIGLAKICFGLTIIALPIITFFILVINLTLILFGKKAVYFKCKGAKLVNKKFLSDSPIKHHFLDSKEISEPLPSLHFTNSESLFSNRNSHIEIRDHSASTNPSTGLPMAGSSPIDISGNIYGTRR